MHFFHMGTYSITPHGGLFEGGGLFANMEFYMGAYSRVGFIRGWGLNRSNTVAMPELKKGDNSAIGIMLKSVHLIQLRIMHLAMIFEKARNPETWHADIRITGYFRLCR